MPLAVKIIDSDGSQAYACSKCGDRLRVAVPGPQPTVEDGVELPACRAVVAKHFVE